MLAVIAGEVSVAEAARKEGVSEPPIHKWKKEFLEADCEALTVGRVGPSSRELQLEAEVADRAAVPPESAEIELPQQLPRKVDRPPRARSILVYFVGTTAPTPGP